jgi:hypothetical protein
MRYIPPKRPLTFNGLHGVISQKIVLFNDDDDDDDDDDGDDDSHRISYQN